MHVKVLGLKFGIFWESCNLIWVDELGLLQIRACCLRPNYGRTGSKFGFGSNKLEFKKVRSSTCQVRSRWMFVILGFNLLLTLTNSTNYIEQYTVILTRKVHFCAELFVNFIPHPIQAPQKMGGLWLKTFEFDLFETDFLSWSMSGPNSLSYVMDPIIYFIESRFHQHINENGILPWRKCSFIRLYIKITQKGTFVTLLNWFHDILLGIYNYFRWFYIGRSK